MEIKILKRTNTPWDKLDVVSHLDYIAKNPFIPHPVKSVNLRNNIVFWNGIFKQPYVRFREGLMNIQARNLFNTGIKVVEKLDGNEDPDDSIIIPMDDDDWLAPNIKVLIEEVFLDEKIDAVIWNTVNFSTMTNQLSKKYDFILAPSYALRTRACTDDRIMWHNLFEGELDKITYCRLPDEILAYYIRHPASTYLLRNNLLDFSSLEVLNNIPPKLESTEWAWEYLEELNLLMKETFALKEL